MVSGRSADRATWYGLPLSSDSSCASSSACFSMRSASLFIKTPRSAALILRHGPLSNAALAAATALSTSAASDSATRVITSPVDGLIVGKVFPDTLSTHFPLISSFVGPILTFCSNTAAAVAILISSYFRAFPRAVISSAARNLSSLSMTSGVCRASPQAPHGANVLRPRSLYPRTGGGKDDLLQATNFRGKANQSQLVSFPSDVGWPCLLQLLEHSRQVGGIRAKENLVTLLLG